MPKKIVYIASLGHSGSTLLDLILGCHPDCIGLGEINQVVTPSSVRLDETQSATCSCGEVINNCSYWGQVLPQIQKDLPADLSQKYHLITHTFDAIFGAEKLLVDSSKSLALLNTLERMGEHDIQVIHIIKDVRAYAISNIDLAKSKKSPDRAPRNWRRFYNGYLRKFPFYHFRYWYNGNRRIQSFLGERKINSLQIGYEELCLYPEQMIPHICNFLGLSMWPTMAQLNRSHSHNIFGNRMKNQSKKRERIYYDHRWFYRNEWIHAAAFFPRVMKYNREEVYSNELGALWSR